MFNNSAKIIITSLLLFGALNSLAVSAHKNEEHANERVLFVGTDTPAAQAVSAFHQALNQSDQKKARSLLADNVIIFEGGGVERSADEYANHHMLADMKYLSSVNSKLLEHQVYISGDIAYSISRSETMGSYKGKAINTTGMESMALKKTRNGWKITHIHWSN